MTEGIDKKKFVADLAELFVVSKTAAEYCRTIVLTPIVGKAAVGSQILTVNQDASVTTLSSFGTTVIKPGTGFSIWDDNLVARAIRENVETSGQMVHPETGDSYWVFVYPYRRPSNPVGAVVMIKNENWAVVLDDEDQRTLSLMGALWLETLGVSELSNGAKASSPEELTARQRTILQLIAEGKTNAEIAKELILSESSIRQETVRIYKSLGVGTRGEASKRAVHLGLIDRVAI